MRAFVDLKERKVLVGFNRLGFVFGCLWWPEMGVKGGGGVGEPWSKKRIGENKREKHKVKMRRENGVGGECERGMWGLGKF